MKKTALALAASAMLAAGATQAAELYNDGTNAVSVGGRINLMIKQDDGVLSSENNSSRINFTFKRQLSEDVTARAAIEYGMNDTNGNSSAPFFNRLGYIAFDHSANGTVTFGKQWGTYYNVAGVTDAFWVNGGNAMGIYDNGHNVGTARANDAIRYDNTFYGVDLSAQYQFEDETEGRKNSYAVSAIYPFAAFGGDMTVGAAYHSADMNAEDNNQLIAASATFTNEEIYAALALGQFENHIEMDGATTETARGLEGIVNYTLHNNVEVYAGFNFLKDSDSSARFTQIAAGTTYRVNGVRFYAEVKNDETKSANKATVEDSAAAVGVRFDF